MRWSAMRAEVLFVLRQDLRRLRARMNGLGRETGEERDASRVRLMLKLEECASITRETLRIAEAATC